jgi:hypothetical protein
MINVADENLISFARTKLRCVKAEVTFPAPHIVQT